MRQARIHWARLPADNAIRRSFQNAAANGANHAGQGLIPPPGHHFPLGHSAPALPGRDWLPS